VPERRNHQSSGLRDNHSRQTRDGPVQRRIGAPHRFDLVDGVQYGGVMPAAELSADFLQRRSSDLPGDVHGDLAREGKDLFVAPHLQVLVTQFAKMEVLTNQLLN
jgi:hypothetical protein